MPIRPYLEGDAFDPRLIETMAGALADACRALGLKDKEDAAVQLLAKRIIDAARGGIHDRVFLKDAAIEGLRPARER